MHETSGCNCVSSFSHIGKIKTFQTLKSEIEELTNICSVKFHLLFKTKIHCMINHDHMTNHIIFEHYD